MKMPGDWCSVDEWIELVEEGRYPLGTITRQLKEGLNHYNHYLQTGNRNHLYKFYWRWMAAEKLTRLK